MKKVLGGKEKSCINCGGTMIHLKVKGLGVVSQCQIGRASCRERV